MKPKVPEHRSYAGLKKLESFKRNWEGGHIFYQNGAQPAKKQGCKELKFFRSLYKKIKIK